MDKIRIEFQYRSSNTKPIAYTIDVPVCTLRVHTKELRGEALSVVACEHALDIWDDLLAKGVV